MQRLTRNRHYDPANPIWYIFSGWALEENKAKGDNNSEAKDNGNRLISPFHLNSENSAKKSLTGSGAFTTSLIIIKWEMKARTPKDEAETGCHTYLIPEGKSAKTRQFLKIRPNPI